MDAEKKIKERLDKKQKEAEEIRKQISAESDALAKQLKLKQTQI